MPENPEADALVNVRCGIDKCKNLAVYQHIYYARLSRCEEHWKSMPASALGSLKSEKKAAAARENGKKGGRPLIHDNHSLKVPGCKKCNLI